MTTSLPSRPPRALASRHWRRAAFASLDFETTGLDLERDDIISFGVVPIDAGRIGVGGATYREVRPAAPLGSDSVSVHGLRPMDLADAPPLDEALHELADALAGRFVLAWAAEIEAAFLARAFGHSATWWRRRIIDVLRLAVSINRSQADEPVDYTLTSVARHYGVPVEDPHHALDDALTTAQLFLVLVSQPEFRDETARRLLRATRP